MRALLHRITKNQAIFLAGLFFSLVGLTGVGSVAYATSADCDSNAVMYCGFGGTVNFIEKAQKNDSGNGHQDLQSIYAAYGLPSTEYGNFTQKARTAYVYKDGSIKVDGVVVGTGAVSWGRNQALHSGTGMQTKQVGSTTLYGNTTSRTFNSDGLEGRVLFDNSGTPKFVVLRSCGNPVTGTFTKSDADCTMLNKAPVSGKADTYNFTTTASATGNAKLTKFVYDFGDGTPTVTTTSATQVVSHTYTKPGKWTAKVTVHASAPGGVTVVKTCQTAIEVLQAYADCVQLNAAVVNQADKYTWNYTAKMKYGNGANFVGADFDFGDGTKQTGVKSADGQMVSARHTYTKGSDYVVVATLHFTENGTSVRKTCQHTQTVVNPYGKCVQLGGAILDRNKYSYRYVATMDYGNGASFIDADFDFGDGKTATGIKSTDGKTVSIDHTYAQAGNYSTRATLHFSINGQTQAAPACAALVTPTTPPTPECKPGVPVGDLRCNPCQYDANYPASDTVHCVAPASTTLPNTGAGNVVAISAAVLVAGFLWYRHLLFKRHKAAYLAADFGISPLPLGEPLESDAPLAATPLASARNRLTLRRRQQY
ncbi:PKD domain-containing protein [Candidatus Saccharibacteria bacterium]|nr:PKD domain-containing protein [Candidatus Saccharibacteria bacterium]